MAPRTKTDQPDVKENSNIHTNMRFYALVQDTPQEAQKPFNNGHFSGTDINPMWRIKKLTEIFGPAGQGWWTEDEQFIFQPCEATGEIAVFCTLHLLYVDPVTKEVSKPIFGVGGNKFLKSNSRGKFCDDEAYKMAYTDAVSIACKAIGFSSDIYFSKDRTKYTPMLDDLLPDSNLPAPSVIKIEDLIKDVDLHVKKLTVNMTADQKKTFANDVIKKEIGQANYLKATDAGKLSALLETLKEMPAQAE